MPKITPLSAKNLRKIFEIAGFTCVRIEGDHFVYTKKGIARPVVIPNWKEVPVFIIKNNLRTAGITREEYFHLLKKL
ncbi:MAG: type II toxin-antitoxin system HicA family toxin [Nitrospinota bacterium]|jgi:predicted RNA binding protein YcfA (HicA-like mRNA interferase family)|nr:type II toxin-antitoxin system HicA family toxin [Nitrospinota bacterium]HJP19876.1 type II toxin-antitoxin system HicA family toxin [Nitrospinota bacterium]|tara:strand:+ start:1795 stop:2025 length:231 start_codon:yes stop_codon:yes gene_type:complete